MKAALEIWGANPDLFWRGNAKETNDAAIVKATMAKPGAVLKRAVGRKGAFSEHANLPDVSAWKQPARRRAVSKSPAAPMAEPLKVRAATPKVAERKAARQYKAARKKVAHEAAGAEALELKARERRKQALEKAEAALKAAQDAHDRRVAAIEGERAALERRARDEAERWQDERGASLRPP